MEIAKLQKEITELEKRVYVNEKSAWARKNYWLIEEKKEQILILQNIETEKYLTKIEYQKIMEMPKELGLKITLGRLLAGLDKRVAENRAIIFKLIANMKPIENFIWSRSPYSFSMYYHHKDDVIDWGTKPVGSYRIADHWNWEDKYDMPFGGFKINTHCPTIEGVYQQNAELRIMTKNGYALCS